MKLWVAIAVSGIWANVCLAQNEPTTTEQSSAGKHVVKKATTAKRGVNKMTLPQKFSMDVIKGDYIAQGYTGMPIAELIDAIEKRASQKKGEFESTAEFEARKAAAISTKFLGDFSVQDTFAFVEPVKKDISYSNPLDYDFNADTGELSLYVMATSSSLNGIGAPDYNTSRRESQGLDQIELDMKSNSTNTYEASNAYGAKVTVTKYNSTQFGIAANTIPFLQYERASYYTTATPVVKLNMENAKAAKELPNLRALIVMKLADPYIVYNFMHSAPTRDDPTEVSSQGKYLTGDVQGIVFYSGITGEVFARLPVDFGKPEAKPLTQSESKP